MVSAYLKRPVRTQEKAIYDVLNGPYAHQLSPRRMAELTAKLKDLSEGKVIPILDRLRSRQEQERIIAEGDTPKRPA